MKNNGDRNRVKLKKRPALYIVIAVLWAALSVLLWLGNSANIAAPELLEKFVGNAAAANCARVLIVLNTLFISYFWLNGIKDFLYVIWYCFSKRKLEKSYLHIRNADTEEIEGKVALIYCTCNDFDGTSLEKSMKQLYSDTVTVILDDSTEKKYKDAVDAFASAHEVKVVRRKDRKGFKAGNINNYLKSDEARAEKFKYIVILDSDEIIPQDFILRCFKYFAYYSNVGIVQAGHVATRNRNFFMKLFHIGVNSHWNTYQTMKHRYGFASLLGHGAMISMSCYDSAGGFPELVAEDLCLSIEARNRGFYTAYAPDIVCEKEYPVDYAAFKKRHSKWTQGNMEFIKNYTGKILRSEMQWYEKLDIFLFTYNLPLTAVFALFILINVAVLPLILSNMWVGMRWMIIPTVVFFVSPMLNDVFFWIFRLNFFRFLFYLPCVFVLYGSMFFITFSSSLLGLFGKRATFIVTPKNGVKYGLTGAIALQLGEILFSSVLIAVAAVCSYFGGHGIYVGISSVLLIGCTGYLSVFLPLFSNRTYKEGEVRCIDEKTKALTLKRNGVLSQDMCRKI